MSVYNDLALVKRVSPFTFKVGESSYWPPDALEHDKLCIMCAARSPQIGADTYCCNEASQKYNDIVVGSDTCEQYVYPSRKDKEYKD